jgi:thymidylate synthase (FAD)
MASYTSESQHYIKYDRLMVVVPMGLSVLQSRDFLQSCINAFKAYRALIDQGYPSFEARAVLPNATACRIVVSMNARSLYNFFDLRCCNRNTWEIKVLAYRMLEECAGAAPMLFSLAGPRCMRLGFCPEGKLSCGAVPAKAMGKPVLTWAMDSPPDLKSYVRKGVFFDAESHIACIKRNGGNQE